jgi:hypothetical protein
MKVKHCGEHPRSRCSCRRSHTDSEKIAYKEILEIPRFQENGVPLYITADHPKKLLHT